MTDNRVLIVDDPDGSGYLLAVDLPEDVAADLDVAARMLGVSPEHILHRLLDAIEDTVNEDQR